MVADIHAAGEVQLAEGGDYPLPKEEEDYDDKEEEEDDKDNKYDEEEDPEKVTDPDFDDMIASGYIKMKVHASG